MRLLAQRGIEVDFATLPWDDPAVYELLQRGETVGVYQLESEGMRRTLAQVRPSNFGDIIALVSFLMIPVEAHETPTAQEAARPKLVVMVVFDQMRGDYLKKWQPLFADGGFKRLQTEGAWFTNCHYPMPTR